MNCVRSSAAVGSLLLWLCAAGDSCDGAAEAALFAPAPGPAIRVGAGSNRVAVGDMDGDRQPDLIVASGKAIGVSVLLAKPGGRFESAGAPLVLPESVSELAAGDVDGDGDLDLAAIGHDSYAVTLMLGDGRGALALAPSSPVVMKAGKHPHTHGLGLADMNGDGKLDLVTVNNADDDVSVALGDGGGKFELAPGSPFAVGPSPYPLAIGDVDGDGRLDIVATASATGPRRAQQLPLSRALTLLRGDGKGGFVASRVPLRTGEPWRVAIGDVNGDGSADLLATHHEMRQLSVVLGDGKGGFAESSESPLDCGGTVFQLALADVDGDGKLDALAASGEGMRVMLGDGRGGFRAAPHSPFRAGPGTWSFALADVNVDGKPDIVAPAGEDDTIHVLLGR